VVIAQSKIRAVRRVIKQLLVEMLQQWSNVSSCMQTSIIMEERYTGFQHFTLLVVNGNMQIF
jgi:hypothetical protein